MTTVNKINKIFGLSRLTIKPTNITSLLFVDRLAVSLSRYSIIDGYINLLDTTKESLILYQNTTTSYHYEFKVDLTQAGKTLFGSDFYGNTLAHLTDGDILVFVDGYKLLPSQFEIINDGKLKLLNSYYGNDELRTVIIYASEGLKYVGNPTRTESWNQINHTFDLEDYTYLRYMFFKNGEIIRRDEIEKNKNKVTLNVIINDTDIIEYYMLPFDTLNLLFDTEEGYYSYGPKDNSNLPIPVVYNCQAIFDEIVRLAIDDVRVGFFIREVDGDGCLEIVSDDFETTIAKCLIIYPFSKEFYTNEEFYVQVPNARSILKYISEFELNKTFLPEILGSFQKLLLNETYDSIQRIKDMRSINRVSSDQITNLISFLGLNVNVSNISLERKHALLEELTNFYDIVGTRTSYEFYNTLTTSGSISNLFQLFTPIKDLTINDEYGPAKRYVTFKTAEELGAVTKTRYEYPMHDLGQVSELAEVTDSFTNKPRSRGKYPNMEIPPIIKTSVTGNLSQRPVTYVFGKIGIDDTTGTIFSDKNKIVGYIEDYDSTELNKNINKNILSPTDTLLGVVDSIIVINTDTESYNMVTIEAKVTLTANDYTIQPTPGPNQPQIDFGLVDEPFISIYDFGSVDDIIKGKWIQWTEWDRPKKWHPTNHVEVNVKIPPDASYEDFMAEFKKTFYDIASAVLYIHSIVEVYEFGNANSLNAGGMPLFDLTTAPVYYEMSYTFTNDPARQDYRY